jgi:rhamnose utilization protein RhaD (predicted bifunctional aldolase and dehydrogenase)
VIAADVASLPGVAALVSRSRAIGADPTLVVHGGGNTSCKTWTTWDASAGCS